MDLFLLPAPVPPATLNEKDYLASDDGQGVPGNPHGDPIEILDIVWTTGSPWTVYLAVDHYAGPQDKIPQNRRTPVEFWVWVYRAAEAGVDVPLVGPTTTGHQTANGVACVGAVRFEESPAFDPASHGPTPYIDPEFFTALGGTLSIPFDKNGRFKPRSVTVPNMAALDGCDTLFFGFDYPDGTPFPNFFGTSAAAPNAAAVAALLRQADPKLKPADILKIMMQTATDVTGERAAAGFDAVSGAGLVNAQAALARIRKGENLTVAPYAPEVVPSEAAMNVEKIMFASPYLPVRLSNSPEFVPVGEPPIVANAPVYAWFTIANTGNSEAGKASVAQVAVDGVVVASVPIPPLYGPGEYGVAALELPPMQVGSHTLEVRADATGRIRELNEADNVFTRTVEVMPESGLVK
jgi:subtilisin family serine protease